MKKETTLWLLVGGLCGQFIYNAFNGMPTTPFVLVGVAILSMICITPQKILNEKI